MNCGLIFVLQKPNAYVGFSELITTTCWNIRFLHAETTRSNSDTLCRGTLLFSFCTLTQIEIPLLTELTFSVTKRIHVGLGYDVQCISLTNRNFLRTILTMTMNRPFHDTEISVISAPGWDGMCIVISSDWMIIHLSQFFWNCTGQVMKILMLQLGSFHLRSTCLLVSSVSRGPLPAQKLAMLFQ